MSSDGRIVNARYADLERLLAVQDGLIELVLERRGLDAILAAAATAAGASVRLEAPDRAPAPHRAGRWQGRPAGGAGARGPGAPRPRRPWWRRPIARWATGSAWCCATRPP